MNFKLRNFTLFLLIFISSGSFAQYKYDIGLKASSYDMERFQLEQRFHLKSPYSIVITLASGGNFYGNNVQSGFYDDGKFDITQNQYKATNNALKVGVQRKLGFLATDVFYAGATLGFGFEEQRSTFYSATYTTGDSTATGSPYNYPNWQLIDSKNISNRSTAMNAQLGVSFGMDVPISKHFSINAEVAFAAIYYKSFENQSSFITLQPSVSGGLRYQFGKRE